MQKVIKVLTVLVLAMVLFVGVATIVQAAASGGIYPLKNGWSFGAPSDVITHFGGTPVGIQSLTNTVAVQKSLGAPNDHPFFNG